MDREKPYLSLSALLLLAGSGLLLTWAGLKFDAQLFAIDQGRQLEQQIAEREAGGATAPGDTPPALETGALIGRLELPRVGLSAIVVEGVEPDLLQRAVGHLPETPPPGRAGNAAIAGHRDTLFRKLRHARDGDEIVLTTPEGRYRYVVEATRIVEPEALEVLADRGHESMTLITCYPFEFIGPAPLRFVVHARRDTSAEQPQGSSRPSLRVGSPLRAPESKLPAGRTRATARARGSPPEFRRPYEPDDPATAPGS